MKILFLIFFFCAEAFAQTPQRFFVCDSQTSGGDKSSFRADVDTGDVSINYGTEWTPLYATGIYCGLKMKAVNCTKTVTHNLDDTEKTYAKMTSKYECKIGGIYMDDANGYLEINTLADNTGVFICGRFSKNDLLLSNCHVVNGARSSFGPQPVK